MDRKLGMQTDKLVAACAVGVVTLAGLGAAFMSGRQDNSNQVVAGVGQVSPSANDKAVVTAPPLKPPPNTAVTEPIRARDPTHSMGAAPVCRDCGVVQMVVAVLEEGARKPNGYQMHIRMDDGSVRTVQQRGALAAGSRVMVEGETVRVLAEPPRPG